MFFYLHPSTDRSHLYRNRVPLNPLLTHPAAKFYKWKNTSRFTFHEGSKLKTIGRETASNIAEQANKLLLCMSA